MKKIFSILGLAGMAFTLHAQGISFENSTWKDVLAKASKENKLIYLDVYTTWCGPCKIMASTIFPTEQAGEKYNKAFVNYQADAEHGEGVALAKQYKVDGYPTNLYIDPKTEAVVYRVMGATELPDFLDRADIALSEQKDPMKWEDYVQKFDKGNRDKAFLMAYAEKAKRLSKPNDQILDAYAKYATGKPDSATLAFLVTYTHTLSNKAADIIFAHKDQVMAMHPENKDYFFWWTQSLPYATLEQAIENKDEKMLETIESAVKRYDIPLRVVSDMYYYKKEFYTKTGNEEKAKEATIAEADYLIGMKAETYREKDEASLKSTRESILYQLKAMKVPEEKYESSIQATLDKNPDARRSATINAAEILNESAWSAVERKVKDPAELKRALAWSDKALQLAGEKSPSWPLFADTYANLLYFDGQKEKAVAMEEDVVKKAEAQQMDGLDGLKETLSKMKSGQL